MLPSVVPQLKARVLSMGFVKSNPKIAAFMDHPAGPFTSESHICPQAGWESQLISRISRALGTGEQWGSKTVHPLVLLYLSAAVHFWAPR
jgi:hypothetical protein